MASLINALPQPNDPAPDQSRVSLLNGTALAPPPTQADAWEANTKAYGDWLAKERADGVAKGLIDPQTGWPTKAGLEDAAGQMAQAVMMGTAAPESVAGRIAGYASKMGYDVDRDSSKISGSEYLNLTHDALPGVDLKVRVSSHDLPSQYGSPGDYDVHAGDPRDNSVGWADVVKSLADRVGANVPGPVSTQLGKQAAAEAAQTKLQLSSPGFQEGTLAQTYPDEWSAAVAQHGSARSQARRDVAAKYEAANPGQFQWAPYLKPK